MSNTHTEQDPCAAAVALAQHRWLQQLVGQWSFEGEADMGPGQPAMKHSGQQTVRSLGELWVLCESQGSMPDGSPAQMLITLGYDPQKSAFVGTFVGSMMTHLWHYAGSLDAAEKVLALDTEGPSFSGDGTLVRYQDIITLQGPDAYELASQVIQADGSWKRFMTASYRRAR